MRVVSAQQMREIEERGIRDFGIPSLLLMENAAFAVVQEIRQILAIDSPELVGRKVTVLVGKGNNGGDGLAIARHLAILEMDVTVFSFAKAEAFKGDAALNYHLFKNMEQKLFTVETESQLRLVKISLAQAEIVVDALYGTGFRGTLPELIKECVEEVNRSQGHVVAVDIPSGVEADTGHVAQLGVMAQTTVTFGLPKLGHFLGKGPEHSGNVVIDPISIPPQVLEGEGIHTFALTSDWVRAALPLRHLQGHKGSHGRGILVAGSAGMTGAAILAGKAALRCGIGLLQIVAPQKVATGIDLQLTEATLWPAPGEDYLDANAWPLIAERCQSAQALAIGPGLGQHPDLPLVIGEVLRNIAIPVVLDADALNALAKEPAVLGWRGERGTLILTPHPGEMARLCGCSIQEVQENRLELALAKAREWGVVIVLKGAITVIATPEGRAYLNPTGNPGLGTGGTGDVLTGSILAWLAQGVSPEQAACLGVYLHGKAADDLAKTFGWSGFTATEVADQLALTRRSMEMER